MEEMTKINLSYSDNDNTLTKIYTKAEYYFNKIPKRRRGSANVYSGIIKRNRPIARPW